MEQTQEGTFSICEACREEVDPEDPDVMFAHKMVETRTVDGGRELIEGLGVYFHRAHFPGGKHYRLARSGSPRRAPVVRQSYPDSRG
jgi:hypothetical protein